MSKFAISNRNARYAKATIYGTGMSILLLEKVVDLVAGMEKGWTQTGLIAGILGALCIITIFQARSDDGPHPDDEGSSEDVSEDDSDEDLLKQGRK